MELGFQHFIIIAISNAKSYLTNFTNNLFVHQPSPSKYCSFFICYSRLKMDSSSQPPGVNDFLNDSSFDQENGINDTISTSGSKHATTAETFIVGLKIVVGFAGILGNTMVCVVLSKMRSEKVNFLIRSQAIIDLVTSAFFVAYAFGEDLYPFSIPRLTVVAYLYCLIWKSTNAKFWLFSISTYNLIAISIERYISIIHPLWYLHSFTKHKTILLACCAWFLGPIFQILYSVSQTFYVDGHCTFNQYQTNGRIIMGIWLFIWDFFMPCMIMTYCSTKICLVVISQKKQVDNLKTRFASRNSTVEVTDRADARRSRSITITFIVVVLTFVVCWSTDQFTFLYQNISGFYDVNPSLTFFSHAMAQLNSAVNPIIYVLFMREYREKVMTMFCYQ